MTGREIIKMAFDVEEPPRLPVTLITDANIISATVQRVT
jgi:hypothetical protein